MLSNWKCFKHKQVLMIFNVKRHNIYAKQQTNFNIWMHLLEIYSIHLSFPSNIHLKVPNMRENIRLWWKGTRCFMLPHQQNIAFILEFLFTSRRIDNFMFYYKPSLCPQYRRFYFSYMIVLQQLFRSNVLHQTIIVCTIILNAQLFKLQNSLNKQKFSK